MRFLQPPRKIFYLKEFPFHFNKRAILRMRTIGEFVGIILLTAFIGYILLNNISPFGVTTHYSSFGSKNNISELGPKNRVNIESTNGQNIYYQFQDFTYFTTAMPFLYETAKVRIIYKNPNPNQVVSLGFQDQKSWHYDTKTFDVPFINNLKGNSSGNNPLFYQREKNYDSLESFLANPPKNLLIGIYDYETSFGRSLDPQLDDYQPASQNTILDMPLRGKHTIYVYLKNEPFSMTIQKQDLNWYEDPDTLTIKVYKDADLVYQVIADDDGISDDSKKLLPLQEITIKNPGPDLPENGVYRIVIDNNGDTIIKSLTTNLHKIVFSGSIFPVANKEAYGLTIASTSSTTVFTNALLLSAITHHSAGLQNITVGTQPLQIDTIKTTKTITPPDPLTKIEIPKNDVILNGLQGYFAFSEDQFFLPTPYRIVPITSKDDVELVDYILTNYQPPQKDGDWQVQELTFDIRSAYIKNGRLSWIISAPGLKENNREIIIKDIEVTLHKKPWL